MADDKTMDRLANPSGLGRSLVRQAGAVVSGLIDRASRPIQESALENARQAKEANDVIKRIDDILAEHGATQREREVQQLLQTPNADS